MDCINLKIGMTEAEQVRLDNLLLVETQTKKIATELHEKVRNLSKDVTAMVRLHEVLKGCVCDMS